MALKYQTYRYLHDFSSHVQDRKVWYSLYLQFLDFSSHVIEYNAYRKTLPKQRKKSKPYMTVKRMEALKALDKFFGY